MAGLCDQTGISGDLAKALLARRLYKRAFGWREVDSSARAAWRRLLHRPDERRAVEDAIAAGVHSAPGSVLIDLAGLERHEGAGDGWGTVRVLLDGRPTFPFRSPGPWRSLASRPPADWAVSVYVAPRVRASAARWLSRDRSILP
jgi:hypothetical protein